MKSPLLRRVLFMLLFSVQAAAAADLTGTWKLEFKPDFSGQPATRDCAFQQKGQKLTIDCEGQKMSGEVKGRNLKFQHKTGRENEVTATYTGTLDEKGTTLKGVWHLSPDHREGKFEARRQGITR
jgi:hypothetical protein